MKFKLHHPLWTHLPALACIAIIVRMLLSASLPTRVPTHFGKNGLPDSWGSPLDIWLIMAGIPLVLVIGSAFFDERYARQEQERRFNWASLLDEIAVGFLTGVFVKTIPQLSSPEPLLSGQVQMAHLFTSGAVALAALLEWLRQYRRGAQEEKIEAAPLAKSIQSQFQPGGRWMYWEKHDPLWWRYLSVVVTAFCVWGAVGCAKESDYGGVVICALLAMLFASGYGGFRVAVTPARLRIRSWSLGLTFLRLKLANVQSVEVMRFNALADFLGWGLYRYSFSLCAWGFILGGDRGVMICMKNGRKFIIGSHSPDKLAAATEAARNTGAHGSHDVREIFAAVQGIEPSQNAIRSNSDSFHTQSIHSRGRRRQLIRIATGVLGILLIAVPLFYSPGFPKYTITSEGLTIHDMLYPVTLKSADIDSAQIGIVDIEVDPHWHPTIRTNGFGGLRYSAGWFRVAGGENVRMYRTTSNRLVLLPPKGQMAPVMLEVKQPEAFIQELRQAWR